MMNEGSVDAFYGGGRKVAVSEMELLLLQTQALMKHLMLETMLDLMLLNKKL